MKTVIATLSLIFTLLLSVEILNAYNSQLYKKTSNEKFCRSRARDRPSPPNRHIAVTKAHSEVDIDYPDESEFDDYNHIDYEGYAYLMASSAWKGTFSISASAYSYSPSDSGKWWSGVYKMLNPIQTVGYGNNLNDSYAINYFSSVSGKASVDGIRYASDPTNTFESEADAHNFSYNSSVTWRCQRSESSNIHNGSLCPVCN